MGAPPLRHLQPSSPSWPQFAIGSLEPTLRLWARETPWVIQARVRIGQLLHCLPACLPALGSFPAESRHRLLLRPTAPLTVRLSGRFCILLGCRLWSKAFSVFKAVRLAATLKLNSSSLSPSP
ncbi:hypothetical protein VTI28DRAFT_9466 [Corynascus sepedonium]